MKVEKNIDLRDLIFNKISPIDIYSFYMPWKFSLNKNTLSPFTRETNPSFIIGTKFGEITHKAFNSEHRGDCINFVMQMFYISYYDALNKIAKDFGLLEDNGEKYISIIQELPKIDVKVSRPIIIKAKPKLFTSSHIDYLAKGFISPEDLNISNDTKAYALKEWWINGIKQSIKKDEISFIYNLKNERGDWLKIYRPFYDKKEKWRSNIPFQEMHGLENMKGCGVGIVAKSVKDAAVLRRFITPHVCVVQAEDISAISKESVDYINQNCQKVYTSFDSDTKGVKASKEINAITGWNWINVPKEFLEYNVNDWFDLNKHTQSPEYLIEYFKQKIIL